MSRNQPDLAERTAALQQAWALCRRLLMMAAPVQVWGRGVTPVEFGAGVHTGRGTFQKFYEQGVPFRWSHAGLCPARP